VTSDDDKGTVQLLEDDITWDGFTIRGIEEPEIGPGMYTSPAHSGYSILNTVFEDNGIGLHLGSDGKHPTVVCGNLFTANNEFEGTGGANGIFSNEGAQDVLIHLGPDSDDALVTGNTALGNGGEDGNFDCQDESKGESATDGTAGTETPGRRTWAPPPTRRASAAPPPTTTSPPATGSITARSTTSSTRTTRTTRRTARTPAGASALLAVLTAR
jgi:hypothetical protein